MNQTKYIFFTGGVTSSLGKESSQHLWQNYYKQGYRTIQKDPYLNVDPGTKSI
jgi:CTP synthase